MSPKYFLFCFLFFFLFLSLDDDRRRKRGRSLLGDLWLGGGRARDSLGGREGDVLLSTVGGIGLLELGPGVGLGSLDDGGTGCDRCRSNGDAVGSDLAGGHLLCNGGEMCLALGRERGILL